MAIVRRGTPTTAAATTGVTSLAFNVPAGVINGDVMWAWLVFGDAVTNVTLTGWTLVDSSPATTIRGWLYRRVASSEPASYTVTWTTTTKPVFACAAYSGVDTTTPEDQHGLASETVARTTHTTPSLTPAGTGRWAIAFYGDRSTSSATKNLDWTSDAALTEILDANNNAAASSPWMSACIDDSNGAVTQAAHSYTATSQISIANAVMALVILKPATTTSVTDSDSSSGSDTASLSVAIATADAGSSTDTAAIAANVTGADTAFGVDATVLTAAVTASDAATGAELDSLTARLLAADTAQAADTESLTAVLTDADTATSVDNVTLASASVAADAGMAIESATTTAEFTAADTATATETATVGVFDGDTGQAIDADTLVALVTAADTAHAVEAAIRAIISGDADITVTAGAPHRGWTATEPARGWAAAGPARAWSSGDPHT